MDDTTAGRALRALRLRRGWRQDELAAAAGVSQSVVSRAERGKLASLPLRTTRGLFAALDAGCNLSPWWRSGQLDRLLDEDHATLVGRAAEWLRQHGWHVDLEVTFAVYGERGSIDLLATRRSDGAVLVVEVKTRLMSVEELLRTLDRKVRLAAQIVYDREGWRPKIVGRLVIFADDSTNRRRVARSAALAMAFPMRAWALRAWLNAPSGRMAGVGFLSLSHDGTGIQARVARQRVRRPAPRTKPARRTALAAPTTG